MDWVKKNYDRVVLLAVSLVVLAMGIVLIQNAAAFNRTFEGVRGEVQRSRKVVQVDRQKLEEARQRFAEPAVWKQKGALLASSPWILDEGILKKPTGEMFYPPVPNDWLLSFNLDLTDSSVLTQDADGDRFNNQAEWEGQTSPRDPESHPPFWTKLRLVNIERVPFRLVFAAYQETRDGLTFQINTIDVKQPSQFLKLGDAIAGTPFKIVNFEKKTVPNPATGDVRDVSELTVEHVETGAKLTMPLQEIVNSPDSFAVLSYAWDGSELKVKRDLEFKLPPDESVVYKVIDIKTDDIVIENTKTGEKRALRIEP